MDKAQAHPRRDQPGLRGNNPVQQAQRATGIGIVAVDDMAGQGGQRVSILAGREILEGAHADMAGRDPGQHRAGQGGFAVDGFAGGHGGQRPGRGHAQAVHGLGQQVFAQHRAQPRAPVAAAAEGGGAGALQLDITPPPLPVDHLAQQNRPPVAKLWHPAAKLVPGIGLRQRLGPVGQTIARQHGQPLGCRQRVGVKAKASRQIAVQRQQRRPRHRFGALAGKEAVGQPGIAVVKGHMQGHGPNVGVRAAGVQRSQPARHQLVSAARLKSQAAIKGPRPVIVLRHFQMQGPDAALGKAGHQPLQDLGADAAPAHALADEKLVDTGIKAAKFKRPSEGNHHISDRRLGRPDQIGGTVGQTLQQRPERGQPPGPVGLDRLQRVTGRDHRFKPVDVVGSGKGDGDAHNGRRARRRVRRSKKPLASTSLMKVALAGRSVTPHQSATVMPRVRSLTVSIMTLTCRPLNRSGRII